MYYDKFKSYIIYVDRISFKLSCKSCSKRHSYPSCYICRDGIRESHVVSKAFDVNQVESDFVNPEEDSMGFMNDIPGNYVSIVTNMRITLVSTEQ